MTYSKTKAATKGLVVLVAIYLVTEVQTMIQAGTFPMTREAWEQRGVSVGLALALGALKVLQNALKHRGAAGNPIPKKAATFPDVYRCLPFVLAAGLVLGGCARNSIRVAEITPDGGSLVVEQKTTSTWGSRTEEGQGSFLYTGESADGSKFDMQAGAAVVGQQSADPSAMVSGVTDLLKTVATLIAGGVTGPPGDGGAQGGAEATGAGGNSTRAAPDTWGQLRLRGGEP